MKVLINNQSNSDIHQNIEAKSVQRNGYQYLVLQDSGRIEGEAVLKIAANPLRKGIDSLFRGKRIVNLNYGGERVSIKLKEIARVIDVEEEELRDYSNSELQTLLSGTVSQRAEISKSKFEASDQEYIKHIMPQLKYKNNDMKAAVCRQLNGLHEKFSKIETLVYNNPDLSDGKWHEEKIFINGKEKTVRFAVKMDNTGKPEIFIDSNVNVGKEGWSKDVFIVFSNITSALYVVYASTGKSKRDLEDAKQETEQYRKNLGNTGMPDGKDIHEGLQKINNRLYQGCLGVFYESDCMSNDVYSDLNEKSYGEMTDIMTQLVNGLLFLHKKGVAHQDIRPPNVLISPSMNRAVLTDFDKVEDLNEVGPKSDFKSLAQLLYCIAKRTNWRPFSDGVQKLANQESLFEKSEIFGNELQAILFDLYNWNAEENPDSIAFLEDIKSRLEGLVEQITEEHSTSADEESEAEVHAIDLDIIPVANSVDGVI